MRILLIEDDSSTAQSIELMLKSEGFNVYTTDLGEEGADLAVHYAYDLILLNDNLPDMSGVDTLRTIRAAKVPTPVLMLSGSADITRKVKAFAAGADDHLQKPFHQDELVARIHAIVRRSVGLPSSEVTVGPIVVDLGAKTARVGEVSIHLTGKEYQVIELLALRKGTTLTAEMFLNHLYGGMDEPESKIIDVFICKIRGKLRPYGAHAHIETIWGRGYRLSEAPPARPERPSQTSMRTSVLALLSRADASFSVIADATDYGSETALRAAVAGLIDAGLVRNIGQPRAALYRITRLGLGRVDARLSAVTPQAGRAVG